MTASFPTRVAMPPAAVLPAADSARASGLGGGRRLPALLGVLLVVAGLLLPLTGAAAETAPARGTAGSRNAVPEVTEADCGTCHRREIQDIQEAGLGHGRLGCTDCHAGGHPPRAMEIIPPCNRCHQGSSHVERAACLPCHRNPHRPRDLRLDRNHVDACLDCHPGPGEDFRQARSAHAIYPCTGCHRTHGELQPCLECHRGHGEAATTGCKTCHAPHRPLAVSFDEAAETAVCVSCHDGIGKVLAASKAAHGQLACAFCHAGEHGSVPACDQCHPEPHAQALLERFAGCGECHADPHDLMK